MKNLLKITSITAVLMLLLTGCSSITNQNMQENNQNGQAPGGSASATAENPKAKQLEAPKAGEKVAEIATSLGTIKVRLFAEQAPEMVKNFEFHANAGNYDNVPFHRVIKDFMIQTGDFTNKNGTGGYSYNGPGTELDDEIVPSLEHLYGTVSMANRGPNTNGSQFFIVTNKNGTPHLDGGYSIFGQVYEGMDVAEQIQNVETGAMDKPVEEVVMNSVKVSNYQP